MPLHSEGWICEAGNVLARAGYIRKEYAMEDMQSMDISRLAQGMMANGLKESRDTSEKGKGTSEKHGKKFANNRDESPKNRDESPKNRDTFPKNKDISPQKGDASPNSKDTSPKNNGILAGSSNKEEKKENRGNNTFRDTGYVGAPYNFIPFAEKVYQYPQGIQWHHNDASGELFTGELTYKITAHTPVIVDGGDGCFFRTASGDYAIPGSTIRGLIRNNAQILGLSSVDEDIDDYALMYRSIASGSRKENKRHSKILGTNNNGTETKGMAVNVKAGYITLENGIYYIDEVNESFDKGANYLALSSRRILSEKENFPFFIGNWKKRMMYTDNCTFVRKEMINGKYKGKPVRFSYQTEDAKEVENCIVDGKISFEISEIIEKGNNTTIVIDSIRMPGKCSEEGEIRYRKSKDSNSTISRTISYDPSDKYTMVNKCYEPYYEPVYFELDETGKRIKSVYAKDCDTDSPLPDAREGYVLSSGWMNSKKNLYIIPEVHCDVHTIKIDTKDIKAFSADLNKRIKTLKRYFEHGQDGKEKSEEKAGDFFGLPKREGERKPVFFIDSGSRLYFGFTPRLRLFYDYTIKNGIKGNPESGAIDYCKAIFGYSQGKESYKSKVSFSDAKITCGQGQGQQVLPEKSFILAEPKPTSYWDYLIQDQGSSESGEPVTYNDSGMKLRGIKQYWLHAEAAQPEQTVKREKKSGSEKENDGPESTFQPLDKGTVFTGKIRFWNLTKEELGLLLWSIRLKPGKSRMNVGKAKPYGYGNISLDLTSAKRLDMQQAYSLEGLNLDPFIDINVEEAIRAYRKHINGFLEGSSIDELSSIREFFAMKNFADIPSEDKIKYMSIDEGDYQNRRRPLQSVGEVIKK